MTTSHSSATIARAQELLDRLQREPPERQQLVDAAIDMAAYLTEQSERLATRADRKRKELLARLMNDPKGQIFTTALTDRVHRSRDPARVVDVTAHLIDTLGVPSYLFGVDRTQLRALRSLGSWAPGLTAPAVYQRLRQDTESIILSSDPKTLRSHLKRRRAQGARLNVNLLGEAVLGEEEAARRVERYMRLLALPDVECVSVKVSSIASQLNLLAWDEVLERLSQRLEKLYDAAMAHPDPGSGEAKLVYLDVEARQDLCLTVELFQRVLDEPRFKGLAAGIAMQAYLPEAPALQRQLTTWAMQRRKDGGAPIRIRLVKGANLAAERVLASMQGWPVPVYPSKHEVDASFKRMLTYACQPEHAQAVRVGVASHNVFDVAYALCVRAANAVEDMVGFELLEGMADPLRRAIQLFTRDVLLYAPVVETDDFHHAMAYLIRRLDENTSSDNFLHHSFRMRAGDRAYQDQLSRFVRAAQAQDEVSEEPRRAAIRDEPPKHPKLDGPFRNEPDTDFSLMRNREWIGQILQERHDQPAEDVPIRVAGQDRYREPTAEGFDPSRPGHCPYRYALASEDDLEQAVATAAEMAQRWGATPVDLRSSVLAQVARLLREQRGQFIATMVLDGGKAVAEADTEVSEAIDFAEYYRRSMADALDLPELEFQPKGVTLVAPPWNFPLAIPAGGVFAALAAGNTVLLKSAPETVLVARKLAELCWRAGLPKGVLQFLICQDELASRLIRDPRINSVILTGATSTAKLFHELRHDVDLMAETGGKNSLIVSALADQDRAIEDLVSSAFRHAGQKCSAASLAICVAEVYDSEAFRRQLRDAADSLPAGSAWDPRSVVTPLIRPPGGALERALQTLDEGEQWLLPPREHPSNPRLWTPGIKLGVREGSFTHQTELFGPVLGVMRARDLEHALQLANATPYGLTAGLHSLDEREQQHWRQRIDVGNAYINRGTTGAVVRRQPFGGTKASSFGPGAKAGGPNYVWQLARIRQQQLPDMVSECSDAVLRILAVAEPRLEASASTACRRSARNYAYAWKAHFAGWHDPSHVLGEDNLFGYRPCSPLLVLGLRDAEPLDVVRACCAAATCGCAYELWLAPELSDQHSWLAEVPGARARVVAEGELGEQVARHGTTRCRALGGAEPDLFAEAAQSGVHICAEPVLATGRVELLRYLREHTLSVQYHRYGNLGRVSGAPEAR
ncbi:MAG: bifunctional proline dehydrogenase/L-glutamate gamma-semialdehyde dehydrogenase [Proteobacteria bacterium]|nr:bifunctional proline dehydrogenase/L-glutamate gamma-semialdehyde dehydrogenase [Pseudomonadota bacterium]